MIDKECDKIGMSAMLLYTIFLISCLTKRLLYVSLFILKIVKISFAVIYVFFGFTISVEAEVKVKVKVKVSVSVGVGVGVGSSFSLNKVLLRLSMSLSPSLITKLRIGKKV